MKYYDTSGKSVVLGKKLAEGGEGFVFDLAHDTTIVAKIYSKVIDGEKERKLSTMVRLASPVLAKIAAWPISTLHQAPGGAVRGILMPKIADHRVIHQLYSPAERKLYFSKADWKFLAHVAMNCAAAFESLHEHGFIVGDVNHSGVLVANDSTVNLIDCDSFQFRADGRLLRCDVGVSEYTPPELQGRSFAMIERTKEHDNFGLALLIFQLLFMGRHPFSGRFLGSGDMTIERAIVEERFVFGGLASSRQMAPPPFSLPLETLPQHISQMFELAFLRPSANTKRPDAAQWHRAMVDLIGQSKPCHKHRRHCYPARVAECPWCLIIDSGGPDFFISFEELGSAGQYELPKIDFIAIWHRIDLIGAPPLKRPAYPSNTRLIPKAISAEMSDQLLLLKVVRVVTLAAALVAIVGFSINNLTVFVGLGLSFFFGIWWLVLIAISPLQREIASRKTEVVRLRRELTIEQQQWDSVFQAYNATFHKTKTSLNDIVRRATKLQLDFESERMTILAQRDQEQRREFLQRHFLRDHRIKGIGFGRSATLLSYGIETANDINPSMLEQLPGFGPTIIRSLLEWRRDVEQRFTFDPSKSVNSISIRSLVLKFRPLQQRCQMSLDSGERELRQLHATSMQTSTIMASRMEDLVRQVRQAQVDATFAQ